ncbi:hypothetical protein [Clostridium merdae]|uniref:hypothetical protein n=1 Tax=Clostridium merdae TaxID=1958780 RepID=UPI00117F179C|nr:hypothetical protein [Clostridium merdae]
MHQLTIKNGCMFLDAKEIDGVIGFELKSSTDGTAELLLKLIVDIASMSISKHVADDLSCNLGENA